MSISRVMFILAVRRLEYNVHNYVTVMVKWHMTCGNKHMLYMHVAVRVG